MKKIIVFSAFALNISVLWAQKNDTLQLKEVVITETKFAKSKEKSGKIIEVITAEQLQKNAGQSVAQVLNQVVGVEVNGSQSSGGKNLGIYVRGGNNRQVLVLIDGIPVSDGSGIATAFDLRLLAVNQIESIEIMKGASSTLYGSGAATAVINIIRKKNSSKTINGNFFTSLATHTTAEKTSYKPYNIQQNTSLSGSHKKLNYQTFINRVQNDGISEAYGKNFENDPTAQVNILQTIGYQVTPKLHLKTFAQWDYFKNKYDAPFDNLSNQDVIENTAQTKQYRLGFHTNYTYKKGVLTIQSAYTNTHRNYQELNSWTASTEVSDYYSRNLSNDIFSTYKIFKNLQIITGIQHQFSDMEMATPYGKIINERAKFIQVEPYTTLVFESNFGLNVNAGGRLNHHSTYGNHWVYNFNPSYIFKNIPFKFVSSISTAYVSPSLFQLYAAYGNPSLTPENNKTIEAGFETTFAQKKLTIQAVSYYRDETNSIGFSPSYIYENIVGKNKVRGVELSTNYNFSKQLKLQANYTFTEAAEALKRLIPKHKANISLDFSYKKSNFLVNYRFTDARTDAFYDMTIYNTKSTLLKAYSIINMFYKTDLITNRLTLNASITNLFNENYTELIGYSTLGRNFMIGFDFNF